MWPNHLVDKDLALEVATIWWTSTTTLPSGLVEKLNGSTCRIDHHRPLAGPIPPHALPSLNVTTLHSIRPQDVLVHGCEHGLHVAGIEPVINASQEFHFIWHVTSACPSCSVGLEGVRSPNPAGQGLPLKQLWCLNAPCSLGVLASI